MPQSLHQPSTAAQSPTAEARDLSREDSHATEEEDDDNNGTYFNPTVNGVDGPFILDVSGSACDKWRISELEQLEAVEQWEVLDQLEEEFKAKALQAHDQEYLETEAMDEGAEATAVGGTHTPSSAERERRRSLDSTAGNVANKKPKLEEDVQTQVSEKDNDDTIVDGRRWIHAGDCVKLLPRSVQLIRLFFEKVSGITRQRCHDFVRAQLGNGDDVTVMPAEAQIDDAYTVEVVTPNDDRDTMTLFQFRMMEEDEEEDCQRETSWENHLVSVFGRFVPEHYERGLLQPCPYIREGTTLEVWGLKCPRGRPLAYMAAECTMGPRAKMRRFQGLLADLAE